MIICYTVPDRCNFYFAFWAIFCPFNQQLKKNQNFKKIKKKKKKTHGNIIILHMCTKNHNHIMYGS